MKIFVLLFVISISAFAHDEGHGPKVKDAGLYGGILASVLPEAELKKNHHAKAVFKAELIRAQDGKLSLYFHTPDMKPATLSEFADEVLVKMEVKKAGKYQYVGEFRLKKNINHFTGLLPTVRTRPFNLDVFPVVNKQKLFVGFSNLD